MSRTSSPPVGLNYDINMSNIFRRIRPVTRMARELGSATLYCAFGFFVMHEVPHACR
jgi:hypothetical protein